MLNEGKPLPIGSSVSLASVLWLLHSHFYSSWTFLQGRETEGCSFSVSCLNFWKHPWPSWGSFQFWSPGSLEISRWSWTPRCWNCLCRFAGDAGDSKSWEEGWCVAVGSLEKPLGEEGRSNQHPFQKACAKVLRSMWPIREQSIYGVIGKWKQHVHKEACTEMQQFAEMGGTCETWMIIWKFMMKIIMIYWALAAYQQLPKHFDMFYHKAS